MIVLVGFMGAGKTTVGRLVAARLGRPFVDTDDAVTRRAGMSIRQIFEMRGEPEFRELEREVVLDALSGGDSVVAVGGGALGDPLVRTAVQKADVVFLDVSYGEVLRRIGSDRTRPLFAGDPKALYEHRRPMYESAARYVVQTDGRSVSDVALEIAKSVAHLDVLTAGTQRVVVSLGHRSYEVVVGRDLYMNAAAFVSQGDAERVFIITQAPIRGRAEDLTEAFDETSVIPHILEIDDGEQGKSVATAADIWERLAERGATRHDVLVGLGGGVVTDVAGFVAATYARGMRLVQIPTTLLGQVDAAIGGKNGINLPAGKNLVGTFQQPDLVLCDIDLVLSLPREEIATGMAEVIKYGLISDPELLDLVVKRRRPILEGSGPELIDTVARCAAIKAHYVMADEFDRGIRQHLNYGHTFAHGIETSCGYRGVTHGQAVSLGMMAAAYLAEDLGRVTEHEVEVHRRTLLEFDLPVKADLDMEALERAWRIDKKYRRGVRFVLMSKLGQVEHGVTAPRDAVERALKRLRG